MLWELVLWDKTRRRNNVAPAIDVDAVDDFRKTIAAADHDTLLIFDTRGQVEQQTQEIAARADLIVQLTGPAQDDLHPALLVFQALTNVGVPEERRLARRTPLDKRFVARGHSRVVLG